MFIRRGVPFHDQMLVYRPALEPIVGWQPCRRTRVSRGSFVASNSFGALFPRPCCPLFPSFRPLALLSFYMDERSLDYPGIILIRPWRRRKVSFEDVLAGYNRPSQITGRKSYDFAE